MASTLGVILILLGGFVLAISYPEFSRCLPPNNNCWSISARENLYSSGTLGLYLGAIIAILGIVILVGPNVARLLGKLKGGGPDSEQ